MEVDIQSREYSDDHENQDQDQTKYSGDDDQTAVVCRSDDSERGGYSCIVGHA